ncbi:MAG: LytTR family DNA-binding domain-containing protein [Flavobacteriaceae bacterium]|nr:LytTR family DNA-binding domain-containing protein [Flavobacteriaceae bacterium]
MQRSCIIVEDQPPAQRILKKYITDIGSLELRATFSNALDALQFLQQEQVDLVFLDIHLPKMSGMDFLKNLTYSPQVILTTAFSEYALESYQYKVVDYLLKPFSFARFVQAVTKSISMLPIAESKQAKPMETTPLFIKSGYDLIKVQPADILYLKADGDYTEIVTDNKVHLSTESLKYWLEHLPNSFCQIHKSYLVHTTHVQKISGNRVQLSNDKQIPIGRAYKARFMSKFATL